MTRSAKSDGNTRWNGKNMGAMTRRRLLGAGVAGSVTLAKAAESSDRRSPCETKVDVIVVGAGFSGLAAARKIALEGRSVLVLEARDRVGGRILNKEILGGGVVEAGGAYIGPTQDRMFALAGEYGVGTYLSYDKGGIVELFNGVRTVGGSGPDFADFQRMTARLQAMADEVQVDAPWRAARAREWDSQTLQTWLEANAQTAGGAKRMSSAFQVLWGAEPREVSLLFGLFYIAAAGNETTPGTFARLADVSNGAQERRFIAGSQLLAQRIAGGLGGQIMFSSPVRAIESGRGGVRMMADGVTAEAQRVIVAIPPALASAISYEPKLPTIRAQLMQHLPSGSYMKCQAIYEGPSWRKDDLTGESLSDLNVVTLTFDNTPQCGNRGVLFGFCAGANARRWSERSMAERRPAVLANFAALFGNTALQALDYFDTGAARNGREAAR